MMGDKYLELGNDEILVIKELFESNLPLGPYHFHSKFLMSPGQIASSIRKLSELQIIETDHAGLKLTSTGRSLIYKQRMVIFSAERSLEWKKVPSRMEREKTLSINTPYMPNRRYLEWGFFFNKYLGRNDISDKEV